MPKQGGGTHRSFATGSHARHRCRVQSWRCAHRGASMLAGCVHRHERDDLSLGQVQEKSHYGTFRTAVRTTSPERNRKSPVTGFVGRFSFLSLKNYCAYFVCSNLYSAKEKLKIVSERGGAAHFCPATPESCPPLCC